MVCASGVRSTVGGSHPCGPRRALLERGRARTRRRRLAPAGDGGGEATALEALHDAAKTCGALHDARKELRRRLLALLFDGEPLRVRATGADLHWDDEDQSDKVRAAATFDERGDGVSTFQLSVALDGFFRPKELAACLQSVVEANKEAPIWRSDVARSAPHLEQVYKRILKLDECVGETINIEGGTRHKWHWPIDLKSLQSHYPSIGEVLRHVQFLRVRVFRPGTQDQLWTHGIGYDRFECCFETQDNRVRSQQGFVVPPLTEFGGQTSVDITIQVKLRLWLGVITLPELKLRLDHASDGDDESQRGRGRGERGATERAAQHV